MDEPEEKAPDAFEKDPAADEATISPGAQTQPRERITEAIRVEGGEKRLGPYRILEEIGRGGMGVVYKAEHPELKRTVALKVLIAGEDASEDAVERFHREAEAVAKLGHHPNIVPVYDIGAQNRVHYIAMHYVDGKPLDALIAERALTPRRAARVARKVAGALSHAHEHGVIHRDVKPANVLMARVKVKASAARSSREDRPPGTIAEEGGATAGTGTTVTMEDWEPRVTDFGLAKDVESSAKFTASGTTLGTPQYMPPEQADGRLEEIDARSDVYSVGAALYEMLCFQPPFEGSSVINVIKKVLLDDPVPPRKLSTAVSKDLETICLKCLEKEPSRRYQTASALEEDLRRYLEDEPISARPASLPYRISKRVRRNPALYLVGTLAILALAAAGIFFLGVQPWMAYREEVKADRAKLDEALAERDRPEKEAEALLERARSAFAAEAWVSCAAFCERVDERYARFQGKVYEASLSLRHPGLLERERFRLRAPRSIPLAEAASLRAKAWEEAGVEEKARGAWARAYWRARQGRPAPAVFEEGRRRRGEEGGVAWEVVEVREILKEALLALGEDLLDRNEFRRARGTFEEYLERFAEPEGGRGTLGLARALQGLGELEEALAALRLCAGREGVSADVPSQEAGGLGPGDIESARDMAGLLEALLPVKTFHLPFPLIKDGISRRVSAFDLDGGGIDEVMFAGSENIYFVSFSEGRAEIVLDQPLECPEENAPACTVIASRCDPDHDGEDELAVAAGRRGAVKARLSLYERKGNLFEREAIIVEGFKAHPIKIASSDVNGGGRDEIVVCWSTPGPGIVAYEYLDGSLARAGALHCSSYPQGMAFRDPPSGRKLLVNLGPYGDYRLVSAEFDPAQSRFVRDGRHPDFLFFGYGPIALSEENEFCISVTQETPDGESWERIVRNMGGDVSACLEQGVYRISMRQWPDIDTTPVFRPPKGGLLPSNCLSTFGFLGRERFAFLVHFPSSNRTVLHVGPAGKGGRGWIRTSGVSPYQTNLTVLELDGDRPPELLNAEATDGSCTVFGLGPAPPAKAGVPPAGKKTAAVTGDPALAIASNLAEMGIVEEAVAAFDEAARSETAEIRGQALLCKADLLAKQSRHSDAGDAYLAALAIPSARPRAILGRALALKAEGRWAELRDFLELEIGKQALPSDVSLSVEAVLDEARTMAGLRPAAVLYEKGDLHRRALCLDPLCAGISGGRLVYGSDASRGDFLALPFRFGGESFRVSAAFAIERLDWANLLCMGFFAGGKGKSSVERTGTILKSHADIWFGSGGSSSFPICEVFPFFRSHGRTPASKRARVQEFPPAYPVRYELTIEYSRESRQCRWVLRDENGASVFRHELEFDLTFAPGDFWFFKVFAREISTGRRGRERFASSVAIERLVLETTPSSSTSVVDTAPADAEHALLLAGGHMAGGRNKEAEDLFTSVIEGDFERSNETLLPDLPGLVTRALLFRGVLRFRMGREEEAATDAAMALQREPALVMYLLRRDFRWLAEEERSFLSRRVLDAAGGPDDRWFETFVTELAGMEWLNEEYSKNAATNFRNLAPGDAGRQYVFANALLGAGSCPRFAHQLFLDTPLEPALRQHRLQDIANQAAGLQGGISDYYASRRWEEFLEEFPDDPKAQHDYAWFLATCPREYMRDPQRALELSRKALEAVRKDADPLVLATYLDTYAVALVASGDADKAEETGKEAVEALPSAEGLLKKHGRNAAKLNELAWFFATTKRRINDPQRALPLASRAVEIARQGGNRIVLATYLDTLAAAQHGCGDAGAAVETQQEALSLLGPGQENLKAEFETRLEQYRQAAK